MHPTWEQFIGELILFLIEQVSFSSITHLSLSLCLSLSLPPPVSPLQPTSPSLPPSSLSLCLSLCLSLSPSLLLCLSVGLLGKSFRRVPGMELRALPIKGVREPCHNTPFIHPLYTLYTPFIAVHTPTYTRYTCTYTIYTPNTPLNTL